MKKILLFLGAILLLNNIYAQIWSAECTFSPGNSTLYGSASRFGFHYDNWSTYYMRYNDSSYFGSFHNYGMWVPIPVSQKISMPEDFIITDFQRFRSYQGFIGSYQGVGMYGKAFDYNLLTPNNSLQVFQLPAVDCLNRIAIMLVIDDIIPYYTKAFAVGNHSNKSYILEYIAEGYYFSSTYYYAQLPYVSTGEREVADDVVTIDNYAVFATRDTRKDHAPINLRIYDTSNTITSPYIEYQWQFCLLPEEHVSGEIRMIPLRGNHFVVAYVVFNSKLNGYYLCVNRIILSDFLVGNNTIVTRYIPIKKSCSNMADIVYEPDVNTMMILLNGDGRSEIYHMTPWPTIDAAYSKLDYPNGNLCSIDTIGGYSTANVNMYVAVGDNKFLSQDISNGVSIENSCFEVSMDKAFLREPPIIRKYSDPIERSIGTRLYFPFQKQSFFFYDTSSCVIIKNDKPIE